MRERRRKIKWDIKGVAADMRKGRKIIARRKGEPIEVRSHSEVCTLDMVFDGS